MTNTMLEVVGVLKLERGEAVELMVYGKGRSTYRQWSIIELLPPTCNKHKQKLLATTR